MNALDGILAYRPEEAGIRRASWMALAGMDLLVLMDLITRIHPSWQLKTSTFVTPAVIMAASLVTAEWLGSARVPHRFWGSTALWTIVHVVASALWFQVAAFEGTVVALNTREWWSGTGGLLAYDKSWHLTETLFFTARIVAASRLPTQFAYRRILNASSDRDTERLLCGFGLGALVLSLIGTLDLLAIPSKFDGRPPLENSALDAVMEARETVWSCVGMVGALMTSLGVAVALRRSVVLRPAKIAAPGDRP